MELFIGILVIVALIVGFMVANDISERHSYEEMRKGIGKKFLKNKEEKNDRHAGDDSQ